MRRQTRAGADRGSVDVCSRSAVRPVKRASFDSTAVDFEDKKSYPDRRLTTIRAARPMINFSNLIARYDLPEDVPL